MSTIKVGIVADNYKVDKFTEELTRAGYAFETFPFAGGTTLLKVRVAPQQVDNVRRLCQTIEIHFKQSN